jgi:hypothetical protein
LKTLLYVVLLGMLVALVWQFPVLWELAVVGAIGGAYWCFFRIPPDSAA